MYEQNAKKQDFIIMGFDPVFKKMFGDVNYTNKAAALVGIFLNVPFENIKDRVDILHNEKKKINKKDKTQEQDVLLYVRLGSGNQFINLEANLHGYNQELIDRNTGYAANTFSRQLDEKQGYDLLESVLQINFNEPASEIKNKDTDNPIDIYLLRNSNDRILTNMFKIINVDIDKCYELWYNGDIKKFTSCEQNIIRIGALHLINNSEDFRKCLGEVEMDETVKNKIQHDMDEYQQDKELAMVYDLEKHNEFVRKSKERALDRQRQVIESKARELDVVNKALNNEKEALNNEKEALNNEKEALNNEKEALNNEKEALNNEKEALNNEKICFARELLKFGKKIDEVSEITGLSYDYINKKLSNK